MLTQKCQPSFNDRTDLQTARVTTVEYNQRRLGEGRSGKEDLGPVAYRDGVVGQARQVGPARRRVSEDERYSGHASRRRAGQVPEHRAARHEDVRLLRLSAGDSGSRGAGVVEGVGCELRRGSTEDAAGGRDRGSQ